MSPLQQALAAEPTSPLSPSHKQDGLSIQAVVAHVCRHDREKSAAMGLDGLIDLVQVCVALGATRHMLNAGLGTQEALERLVHVAAGREAAHRVRCIETPGVEAVLADMRTRLSQILSDWRRTCERFSQKTGLLPAQFARAWPPAPDIDDEQRRRFDALAARMTPPERRVAYDRARDLHRAAQRRCMRAAHDLKQAAEESQRFAGAQRGDHLGGERSLVASAQALMNWHRKVESLVTAEADRLFAQHVMALTVQSLP